MASPFEATNAQKMVCSDLQVNPVILPKAKPLQMQSPFAQPPKSVERKCTGAEDARETVKGYLYDWELVKKMGSSIEDIICTSGKMSQADIGLMASRSSDLLLRKQSRDI